MAINDLVNKLNVGLGAAGSAINAIEGVLGFGKDGGQEKFSINKLQGSLQQAGGLYQPTMWLLQLTSPLCLAGDQRPINFLCNSGVMPGKSITTFDHKRFGYGVADKRHTGAAFNDITFTFFMSNDGEPQTYFNEWLENIFYTNASNSIDAASPTGTPVFNARYRDQITVDMQIFLYDIAQNKIMQYTLHEAFPTVIGEQTLEWGANDSFGVLPITFTFRYYSMSTIEPPATSSSVGLLSSFKNGLGVVNKLVNQSPVAKVVQALNIASAQKLF
jgi:hypothetical protein|tara:strand:- start:140 stop:961 length:822 start_codon:yes stop_codon:yes gene_type:complete